MAEEPELKPIDDEEPEETPGYKAPAQKSVDEIKNLDADDESLVRYKQTLLAGAEGGGPREVIVEKMAFQVEGRPDIELDLTSDVKQKTIVIKEGVTFKLKFYFKVKGEIVSGLKYHHVLSRKGVNVDKKSYMLGCYGPKAESQFCVSPSDEAPRGIIARGHYKVKSKFLDDDKIVHLAWEWAIDIKKDWE